MSGPKVDEAELRRQEAERLRALRNIRMLASDEVEKCIRQLENFLKAELDAIMRDEVLRSGCQELMEEKGKALEQLRGYRRRTQGAENKAEADGLVEQSKELVRQFHSRNESGIRRVQKISSDNEKLRAEIARQDAERQKLKNARRNRIFYLSEEETGQESKEKKRQNVSDESEKMKQGKEEEIVGDESVQKQAKEFEEELRINLARRDLNSRHKNMLLSINRELQGIIAGPLPNDRKSKRIRHLYEDFEKILSRVEADFDVLRGAYEEYKRECFDMTGELRPLSDFSSVEEINAARETIRQKAEKKMARAYIQEQIDDVMKKYGYQIVRSDLLAESRSQEETVLYGVDTSTAIQVFVSENQQVTMRVVGIGFDETVSEEEGEQLYQKQCAFCSMHPKITEELKLRGVILHTKVHMPPDKRFNKKVRTQDRRNAQTTSRAKKELKRAGQKVMHRQ